MNAPLPQPDRAPFALKGERAAALLLHGFTSTPWEVRPVGDALHAAGYEVGAPLLPGHGTTPSDLDDIDENDWLQAARAGYGDLEQEPRLIVGASMGGLLAILLAAEDLPGLLGIALFSPALEYFPTGRLALEAAMRGAARRGWEIPKSGQGGDVGDPEARRLNPTYPSMPTLGMASLERLRRRALDALPAVRCPVYIAHGLGDRTIHPNASSTVARGVNAPFVERHTFPRSRHILGVDIDRGEIAAGVIDFLARCEAVARSGDRI